MRKMANRRQNVWMIYNISVSVVVIVICLAAVFIIFPVSIKKGRKKVKICWYLLVFAFAVFAYYAEPSISSLQ